MIKRQKISDRFTCVSFVGTWPVKLRSKCSPNIFHWERLVNFLVGMAGNLLATPISRLLKKRYGLVCAVFQLTWGATIVLLTLPTAFSLSALLFWLAYLNMGVINSPHQTLLNREIPARQRSSMLSIASLATYVGAMIGGVGLGYVAEHGSIGAAWIVGGMVLVVSLSLYLGVDMRQTKGQPRLDESLADA